MALKASGRGISEAVRDCVFTWLDQSTLQEIYKAFGWDKNTPQGQGPIVVYTPAMRNRDDWIRTRGQGRTKKPDGQGWMRKYSNRILPEFNLYVETNPEDNRITSFMFVVRGRMVAGGVASVKSVFQGRLGNQRVVEKYVPGYGRMTQDELNKKRTEYAFDGVGRLLEDTREV